MHIEKEYRAQQKKILRLNLAHLEQKIFETFVFASP